MSIHFHIVSLFPEIFDIWLSQSILGIAHQSGVFQFTTYPLRSFSTFKHGVVDDVAYGGGGGMVLRLEPLVTASEQIRATFPGETFQVIYFSPAGKPLTHTVLFELLTPQTQHIILICGHYEGVDQRFIDHWVDMELSLGDFVLTGGEVPGLAFLDAAIRQLEGTLSNPHTRKEESFSLQDPHSGAPLLEYPHYTRPADFRGFKVPPILLSGNHHRIREWRMERAKERTKKSRPDLLTNI